MIYKKTILCWILLLLSSGIFCDTRQSSVKTRKNVMNDLKTKLDKLKSSGEDYFNRANYYKKLGTDGSIKNIPSLRVYLEKEKEPWAKSYALGALAKLGDSESQKKLLLEFDKILVDDVDDFVELIQYVGQKKMALGFLSWLDNENIVKQLGHRQNSGSVRWCDYAVWNSHLLGIEVTPMPTHLTNFDKVVRSKLSVKLRSLK